MSNPSARPQGRQTPSAAGYEKRDANAKWIFGIVAFVVGAGLIMHLCIAGVLERLQKKEPSRDPWTGARRSGVALNVQRAPQLQIDPAQELKSFREHEEAELNSYGWINQTAGVVRIPISRAIELIAERGLPTRSQTNASALGPTSYQLQRQRPESPQPEIQGGQ